MAQKRSFGISVITSILGTVATFVILWLILSIGLFISIVAALVIFILLAVVTRPQGRKPGFEMRMKDVDDPKLREILLTGHEKQSTLKDLKNKISKNEIRRKVDKIIDVVERIFDNFREDPKDIKAGRQFLNYYLDSTIKIITRYTELASRNTRDEELEKTLYKTEELLEKVYHSFEEQLNKLQQNDLIDLDVEIKLLEQTLKMEGLDKKQQQ